MHALLHIADGIEDAGPVWAYWAFPTERYCGRLQPVIRSRRYPFANIDNYVVAAAQLSQIKIRYNLDEQLSLKPTKADQVRGSFSHPACMPLLLLTSFESSLMHIGQIQHVSYYHRGAHHQLFLHQLRPKSSFHFLRGSINPRTPFGNISHWRMSNNGQGFVV